MRRAAKRDGNEAELIKIPPLYGWTVLRVSDTGKPDWLCMRRGRVVFIEIKSEDGALTPAQVKEFAIFAAAGCQVHVCRTELDVRKALGLPVEGVLQPLVEHVERLAADALPGFVLTPAFQQAQTTEAVPPRRRKK